jgi:hypothetical protein
MLRATDDGAKAAGSIQRSSGPVHIKLNGIPKNLPGPVTGTALYRLAGAMPGYPVTVLSGDNVVPNNDEPVAVKDGQEFSTK